MNLTSHSLKELPSLKLSNFVLTVTIAILISSGLIACGGSSDSATAAATPTPTPTIAETVPPSIDNGKLKIFILAGQSNMIGYGKVDLGGDPQSATREPNIIAGLGSVRAMVNNNTATYGFLVDASKPISYPSYTGTKTYAGWVTRNDVWVSSWDAGAIGASTERRNSALGVGFGDGNSLPEGYIGPEFGFGHIVGNALGDKVLLIKTAWGGKSLAVDFRPPGSGGTTGPYYTEMVAKVRKVLADVKKYYPDYDGKGYEIAGFGWHQGWNDRVTTSYVTEYEVNLTNLIKDLRKDFGVPDMRVVVANTGMAMVGDTDPKSNSVRLITAQANVADPAKHPEFAGTVSTVDTRPFYYGNNSPTTGFVYHWNYNGESYFHVGESMGTAMLKLMKP